MFRGRWTAWNLVGVRQRSAIHLSTHTLLVKGGLEESRVTVKLHQVEDLWGKKAFVRKVPVEEGVSKSDGEEEIHKETCRVKKKGARERK